MNSEFVIVKDDLHTDCSIAALRALPSFSLNFNDNNGWNVMEGGEKEEKRVI